MSDASLREKVFTNLFNQLHVVFSLVKRCFREAVREFDKAGHSFFAKKKPRLVDDWKQIRQVQFS